MASGTRRPSSSPRERHASATTAPRSLLLPAFPARRPPPATDLRATGTHALPRRRRSLHATSASSRARLVEPSGRGRYRLRERRIVSSADARVVRGRGVRPRIRLRGGRGSPPPRRSARRRLRRGGVRRGRGALRRDQVGTAGARSSRARCGRFLDRVDTLRPDCALFLADTTLRMRDKLVGLFAAEVTRRRLAWDEPARIERELWRVRAGDLPPPTRIRISCGTWRLPGRAFSRPGGRRGLPPPE